MTARYAVTVPELNVWPLKKEKQVTNKKQNLWRVERAREYRKDGTYRHVEGWDVLDELGIIYKTHGTHAEAIAEADRRARTIEVTLPPSVDKEIPGLSIEEWMNAVKLHEHPDGEIISTFNVYSTQARTVALALLAHHYRTIGDNQ